MDQKTSITGGRYKRELRNRQICRKILKKKMFKRAGAGGLKLPNNGNADWDLRKLCKTVNSILGLANALVPWHREREEGDKGGGGDDWAAMARQEKKEKAEMWGEFRDPEGDGWGFPPSLLSQAPTWIFQEKMHCGGELPIFHIVFSSAFLIVASFMYLLISSKRMGPFDFRMAITLSYGSVFWWLARCNLYFKLGGNKNCQYFSPTFLFFTLAFSFTYSHIQIILSCVMCINVSWIKIILSVGA